MNQNRLFATIIVFGLTLPLSSPAYGACVERIRLFWSVDLQKSKVERVHRSEAPISFCQGAPESLTIDFATVRIEIRDRGGQTVFEQKVFLPLFDFYDRLNDKQELTGSVEPAKQTGLSAYVPREIADCAANCRLVIYDLANGKRLAEGAP